MNEEKTIYVFADFEPFHNDLVGRLYISVVRGREAYSFEYDKEWLKNAPMMLDPDLHLAAIISQLFYCPSSKGKDPSQRSG